MGGAVVAPGIEEPTMKSKAPSPCASCSCRPGYCAAAVNKAIASAIAGDAKKFVPVLSGALAASIREAASKTSARVKAGGGKEVAYAGPIHFGWPNRRIKPQPFIYEAIDGRRAEVAMLYAQRLTEIRNRYDL